jgi:hypothetical protein
MQRRLIGDLVLWPLRVFGAMNAGLRRLRRSRLDKRA